MAEITTASPLQNAAPTAAPTPATTAPDAPPTKLQAIENGVFAFIQAHYPKLITAALGFAASHFNLLGKIF